MTILGGSTFAEVAGVLARRAVLGWTHAVDEPLLVGTTWARTLVKAGFAAVLLSPSARALVRRQVGYCFWRSAAARAPSAARRRPRVSPGHHATAALAPLIGFGHDPDAGGTASSTAALAAPEASFVELTVLTSYSHFRSMELEDGAAMGALHDAWAREAAGLAPTGGAAAAGKGAGWSPSTSPLLRSRREAALDDVEAALANRLDVATTPAAASAAAHGSAGCDGFGADVFVVHAAADDAAAKVEALRAWVDRERRAAPEQPPLRAWVDTMCTRQAGGGGSAGGGIRPEQRLAHALVSMHQCRRLLLLAGPAFADSLECATAVHSWQCLGRSLDDVSVALVVPSAEHGGATARAGGADTASAATAAAAAQQILAAFDTFAVMYCTLPRSAEDATRLVHAVELGSPAAYNEATRACVPLVAAAVATDQAERRTVGGP